MTVKKSYDFVHLHKSSLYASEDIARGVEKKLDSLDVIHRSALTGVASIRNSKDLTPKGKQSALDELADKLQRQTKEWQDSHTHYSDYAFAVIGIFSTQSTGRRPTKRRADRSVSAANTH